MTSYTTRAIEDYSTDRKTSNALLALMDYYGKNCLMEISEEQALAFLEKLKKGEIIISNDKPL